MATEKVYPKGVMCFKPSANAPDFKLGTMAISLDEFYEWIENNKQYQSQYQGAAQLKLDILKSRDGGIYLQVDTYKRDQ